MHEQFTLPEDAEVTPRDIAESILDSNPEVALQKERVELIQHALEIFAARCNLQDVLDELDQLDPKLGLREDFPEFNQKTQEAPLDTARLKSEFNIDFPDRYPSEVLQQMLDGDMTGKPWGIVVVAKYDSNGALEYMPQLSGLHEDLREEAAIRVVEASSPEEASELTAALVAKYGKASFGIVVAHGSEKGFTFDDVEGGRVEVDEPVDEEPEGLPEVTMNGFEEEGEEGEKSSFDIFSETLATHLEDDASVVLVSCSTGKGKNPVGKQLARVTHLSVTAPDADTNVSDLHGEVKAGGVEIRPEYNKASAQTFTG